MRKTALVIFVLLSLASSAGGAGQEQTAADNSGTGWELIRLDLDVTLRPEAGEMLAHGAMRVRLTGQTASMGPDFELNRNGFQFVRIAAAGDVKDALVRGRGGRIRFHQPKPRGAEAEVSFRYQYKNPGGVILTPQGAHAAADDLWFPSPSNKPDEPNDIDAAGSVRFRMPGGWRTLAGGKLTAVEENSSEVSETWTATKPVKFGFIAGRFAAHTRKSGRGELRVLLPQANQTKAANIARSYARIVRLLEARFGPFPFEHYGIAEIPFGLLRASGRSLPGYFIADRSNFDERDVDHLILTHELAHAWWGHVVSLKDGPGEALVGEGLAQFSVALVIEALEGRAAMLEYLSFGRLARARRFHSFYQGLTQTYSAAGYFGRVHTGADRPLAQLGVAQQDYNIYWSKGVWVYHMLRQRLGDERFFAILRALLASYGKEARPLSLAELRREFIAAAPPDKKLEEFFAQWLDRAGAPVLEVEWRAEPQRPAHVQLTVRQEGEPFDLLLDVVVEGTQGVRRHQIRITRKEERFSLASAGRPRQIRLDPQQRLLIWRPKYGLKPDIARAADAWYAQQDWAKAAAGYELILHRYPQAGRIWYSLGQARYRLGAYEGVAAAFAQAFELGYLKPLAAYNVACAYALQKERERAITWLRAAIAAGFRDLNTLRTDKDLDSVRDDPRFLALLSK